MKTIYNIIMSGEKSGLCKKLDSTMRSKMISKYFHEKYSMSYHSAAALMYTGEFPGMKKKLGVEITEEVQSIPGCSVSEFFFPAVTFPKLKLNFPEIEWPKVVHRIRPEKLKEKRLRDRCSSRRPSKKVHNATCLHCLKPFEIDPIKHPANLCVCLKCCPDGVNYSKQSLKKYVAPMKF